MSGECVGTEFIEKMTKESDQTNWWVSQHCPDVCGETWTETIPSYCLHLLAKTAVESRRRRGKSAPLSALEKKD